ncbi:unnamed protein product [Tenebrio molitor]|jgi:hypothetical protein|nr:unnamed protein product [Tenebrio molitor]
MFFVIIPHYGYLSFHVYLEWCAKCEIKHKLNQDLVLALTISVISYAFSPTSSRNLLITDIYLLGRINSVLRSFHLIQTVFANLFITINNDLLIVTIQFHCPIQYLSFFFDKNPTTNVSNNSSRIVLIASIATPLNRKRPFRNPPLTSVRHDRFRTTATRRYILFSTERSKRI